MPCTRFLWKLLTVGNLVTIPVFWALTLASFPLLPGIPLALDAVLYVCGVVIRFVVAAFRFFAFVASWPKRAIIEDRRRRELERERAVWELAPQATPSVRVSNSPIAVWRRQLDEAHREISPLPFDPETITDLHDEVDKAFLHQLKKTLNGK